MSLVKIDSSKGLYQVLGGGLLAEPVVIPEFTAAGAVDTSLGFHLHLSADGEHLVTLNPQTEKGQLLLVTNVGSSSFKLDPAALTIDPTDQDQDGQSDWDLPVGDSVLFVSTGAKWSPTSQSLQ